jgi:aspartate aminotransferase
MPESPIRKLVPYAEKARKKGRIIYHLNIGQPDIETPEIARNSVKQNDLKVIEYGHSAGSESYRKKLAEYYKKFKINVDYSDILITTGGSEAIVFAFLSCLNPGDEVIIPEPFYANYIGFAISAGVEIVPITSKIEDSYALPPIGDFEKKVTDRTRAILICNPNNPTGYIYSRDELLAIRDIVKKHNLYLFADEVYKEFRYEEGEYISILHLDGIEPNAVVLDSISKRYSACGVRIGALITRNREIIDTALKFGQARLCPPAYGQIAGEAAIDTPESYFREVLAEYRQRRDIIVKALNKMEGVICPTPKGAFYAGARLPIDDADIFCQWLLEEFEYDNQTVMLAPMSGFYATPGLGKNEVRIGYVLNVEALKNAMKCIEHALKAYPGKTI